MLPPFGFSVGNFIAAAELLSKVKRAFHDHHGASAEYQQLVQQVEALQMIFEYLQTLDSDESARGLVNAIRAQAAVSLQPLRLFLESIEKYDKTLGARNVAGGLGVRARQAQWALSVTKEVPKLLDTISLEIQKMNLMLGMGQL